MSKRKPSSPYKNPPTPLVRALTIRGWRRCDAEEIVAVWSCVSSARRADREQLRLLGARAAEMLNKEPVLGGAMVWVAPWPGAADSLSLLLRHARTGRKLGMYRLWRAAVAAEIDAEDEVDDYADDFDADEDLDDELPA